VNSGLDFSWLHVSDFHLKDGNRYDSEIVLQALVSSVKRFHGQGRKPDLIFATGDIAHSGKASEYAQATAFFDDLLRAAGLARQHLFVVPGNHDCDRAAGRFLVRTLASHEDADAYFAPGQEKPHLTAKQRAYIAWYDEYFAGIRAFPKDASCGPVEAVDTGRGRIGILPLNSALFSQDDADHAKLLIGRRSLGAAVEQLAKLDVDVRIGLLHHPLEWLSDIERSNIKQTLHQHLDFILRGHLHENEIEQVIAVSGSALHLAAGAAYQTRRYPNRALYVSVNGNAATVLPIRYEDAPQEVWVVDPSLFPDDNGHQRAYPIPRLHATAAQPQPSAHAAQAAQTPPRFSSNIPVRSHHPFVGRDALLSAIDAVFSDLQNPQALVLHGTPGVGKSGLAREYARRNVERYPGGSFFIDATSGFLDLARIGATHLGLDFAPQLSLADQAERTLSVLFTSAEPALLIYDNISEISAIDAWLPRIGSRGHMLITAVAEPRKNGWPALHVEPLTKKESQAIVEALGGNHLPQQVVAALTTQAAGLPVQLVPATLTLAYEARRGRLQTPNQALAQASRDSFKLVYARLSSTEQLLLQTVAFLNLQRILPDEVFQHVSAATGWSRTAFNTSLDTCQDLHLLEGVAELRMHQLFAAFVREQTLPEPEKTTLAAIRNQQHTRFLALASALAKAPADTAAAAAFSSFPLLPEAWAQADIRIEPVVGQVVGRALYETGRFEQARPWCERAVAEKEQGDVHGRIDHQSLGASLHQVGYCLSRVGAYEQARPWYERAVAEKEQGDVHGRVDQESLGVSREALANLGSK
jgi:predicted phosphodiesterase/tetratricopeptide (TPR) repeat protein